MRILLTGKMWRRIVLQLWESLNLYVSLSAKNGFSADPIHAEGNCLATRIDCCCNTYNYTHDKSE